MINYTHRKLHSALQKNFIAISISMSTLHECLTMARKLPPLNAVKAFEASARLGGFSLAAHELGVTPGAVSQQVRILEDFFEKQLFVRRNNQVQLTDAGLAVFADSAEAIDRLAEMTQRLLEGGTRSRFVISTLPSVAVRWLNRRLAGFLASEPDIRCEIRVEDDPVDFAHHHIDLRICYGQHLYPELVTVPAVRDEVLPLCSPEFLSRSGLRPGEPESIMDKHLIHIDWGASFASYPAWAEWFRAAGLQRLPQVELGHTTGMSSLAVDLALSGIGIALAQRLLASDELADGRLVAPFTQSLPLGDAYCAVHPHSRSHKKIVQSFLGWISRNL
jgi:LysR family transcriptional regulator, glycine cleavage system transcriptional activator